MIDLEELDAAAKESRQVRREELKAQAKKLKTDDRLARRQARRAQRTTPPEKESVLP